MSSLFQEFRLKDVVLRNRIAVSPMCQYSSDDGFPNDWHLVHLGSRAVGGAGLVVIEATAVEPRGLISPQDSGLWAAKHVPPIERIARFVRSQNAAIGIQLAHAGRKASTRRPWERGGPLPGSEGGWPVIGPSAIPWGEGYPVPHPLSLDEVAAIPTLF